MDWLAQRFELSRGESRNDRAMEGVRGFAVFLVFLVHFVTLADPWIDDDAAFRNFAEAIHAVGNAGVDLFFVLSGYLIYGSLISRAQPFMRFMARRVERIYPTFLVVLAAYLALSFAMPAQSKLPESASDAALYIAQNVLLLPGIFGIDPIIAVAWSLSYEMLYYFAVPLAIAAFGMRGMLPANRVLLWVTAGAAGVLYCAAYGGHVRLVMFISGVVLLEAARSDAVRAPSDRLGVLALAAGLIVTLMPLSGHAGSSIKVAVMATAFPVALMACFKSPHGAMARAFSWRPARWLGNMSYSYYLTHGLALKAGFMAMGSVFSPGEYGPAAAAVAFPVMFAMTCAFAAVLFLAVERPLSLGVASLKRHTVGAASAGL